MRARVVSVTPDPKRIARAVARFFPDVALLHSGTGGVSYVAGGADAVSFDRDPYTSQSDSQEPDPGPWGGVPRYIGVIPYAACRALERPGWRVVDRRAAPAMARPQWLRYPAVARIDPRRGEVMVIGDDEAAVGRLAMTVQSEPDPAPDFDCALDVIPDKRAHLQRVARARELILAGDLYQVSLARRYGFALRGLTEPMRARAMLQLYERATHRSPCRFGAVLRLPEATVVSFSPELLLRAESRGGHLWRLRTEPIKGTRPRGEDEPSDRLQAAELDLDPKERAELAMIIDVERNDLGRVCQVGTVRLVEQPRVITHQTVHHREAAVVGITHEHASRAAVLDAVLPSGSVTGAPKIRAMEVIAELEDSRRGLYTGAVGYVARDGSITLSMAIRTLVMHADRGWYWTGGGIVLDSDPEREWLETEWKAQRLFRALGAS